MWFWFALIFAFLSSLNTLIYKVILKKTDEYVVAWASVVFGLPILALIIFLFYQIPKIDTLFIFGIAGTVSLNVLASILSYRAIKITEISLLAPISAFNPVFTAIFSLIVLGETLSLKGVGGMLLIVLGAYLLNIGSFRLGILNPFKKLLSDHGVKLAFGCNFIWAITPLFEKTAILHTQPQVPPFVSLASSLFLVLALGPIMMRKSKAPFEQLKISLKGFLLAGLLGAVAVTAAFSAFSLSNLGYATAVFKLSMIFSVFWGFLFLKETNIKEKIIGSLTMFIGVVLLVL